MICAGFLKCPLSPPPPTVCIVFHSANRHSYKSEFQRIRAYGGRLGCGPSQTFQICWIKKDETEKRSFLKISFANKGLDAINIGKILYHKSVKSNILSYLKDQFVPIISYTYTTPIATKIFNYNKVLEGLSIDDSKLKPAITPVQISHSSMIGLAT